MFLYKRIQAGLSSASSNCNVNFRSKAHEKEDRPKKRCCYQQNCDFFVIHHFWARLDWFQILDIDLFGDCKKKNKNSQLETRSSNSFDNCSKNFGLLLFLPNQFCPVCFMNIRNYYRTSNRNEILILLLKLNLPYLFTDSTIQNPFKWCLCFSIKNFVFHFCSIPKEIDWEWERAD